MQRKKEESVLAKRECSNAAETFNN